MLRNFCECAFLQKLFKQAFFIRIKEESLFQKDMKGGEKDEGK